MLSDRQPAKWANHYPNTSYLKLQTKETTMVKLNHHIPLCYKYTYAQNQCVQLPQPGCLQQKHNEQKGVKLCQLTLCSVHVTPTVKKWSNRHSKTWHWRKEQREKQEYGSTHDLSCQYVGWVVNTSFIPTIRPSNYCKLQQYTVLHILIGKLEGKVHLRHMGIDGKIV